jgi:hypothetical protein
MKPDLLDHTDDRAPECINSRAKKFLHKAEANFHYFCCHAEPEQSDVTLRFC